MSQISVQCHENEMHLTIFLLLPAILNGVIFSINQANKKQVWENIPEDLLRH